MKKKIIYTIIGCFAVAIALLILLLPKSEKGDKVFRIPPGYTLENTWKDSFQEIEIDADKSKLYMFMNKENIAATVKGTPVEPKDPPWKHKPPALPPKPGGRICGGFFLFS